MYNVFVIYSFCLLSHFLSFLHISPSQISHQHTLSFKPFLLASIPLILSLTLFITMCLLATVFVDFLTFIFSLYISYKHFSFINQLSTYFLFNSFFLPLFLSFAPSCTVCLWCIFFVYFLSFFLTSFNYISLCISVICMLSLSLTLSSYLSPSHLLSCSFLYNVFVIWIFFVYFLTFNLASVSLLRM